jgi:hypothetical protein
MSRFVLLAAVFALGACKRAPPPGNPEFNDALRYAFVHFDDEPVVVAFAIRSLEANIYASMDVTADNSNDRALSPERLTEEDVANLEHPDRDPSAALPVAVAGLSVFLPPQHARIQMLADQTPVEPYSPDFYAREFLDGEECWSTQDCGRLDTWNDLIKKNTLMEIPYQFYKDFRWVDLNLPDPADVPEGEEPTNPGEPRPAIIGRSWQEVSGDGVGGNTHIYQSYTVEVWVPRDEGTLRMMSVWSEVDVGFAVSDEIVAGTTRGGIDKNFETGDEWLAENPE